MESFLDCIPCLVGQCVRAVRLATPDERLQRDAVNAVLEHLTTVDLSRSPIALSVEPHRIIRQVTGCADPYLGVRRRSNREALALYPRLKRIVAESTDPLMTATRIAIAGNIMDFGALAGFDVEAALARALREPFGLDDSALYAARVRDARRVLFVADNAGEIVFDRVLLEELTGRELTVAVKSSLFINDALRADAEETGIGEIATIIEAPPGTSDPADFGEAWGSADLIIAKGQANYEAFANTIAPLFSLLLIKCPILAQMAGLSPQSMALVSRQSGPVRTETA